MTGCSPPRLHCSLWHSQRDALKPCPRIHSPFFSLPSSLPLFHKSTHHFYVLYEHSTPSWHLKTFPDPLRNTLHTYIHQNCAPQYYLYFLLKEAASDPQCHSTYMKAEIFMCIHIFPLPSPGQSQKRTFFCTLGFAIFMRAGDVPMQGKHNDSS